MIFAKVGLIDYAIYFCTACIAGKLHINSMLKWMNFVEYGAILVKLLSFNGVLNIEHIYTILLS